MELGSDADPIECHGLQATRAVDAAVLAMIDVDHQHHVLAVGDERTQPLEQCLEHGLDRGRLEDQPVDVGERAERRELMIQLRGHRVHRAAHVAELVA